MLIPALCREHVTPEMFFTIRALPSQPPQKVALPCSAVHRYCDMVRLLQHVHVRIVVYGLRGPAFIN